MSEITKHETPKTLMVAEEWAMMREQAQILVKSGFLPPHIKTPEQALAIMLKARELDIPPMMAIDQLYVVKGRVTCQGSLIMALLMRSGLLADYNIEIREESVSITMTRTHPSITRTAVWTKDRAIKSGLTKEWDYEKKVFKDKATYTRFLLEMLKWRAVAEIAREIFSDVTGNIYLREEIETSEIRGAQPEPEIPGAPAVMKVVAKMEGSGVPMLPSGISNARVPSILEHKPALPPVSPPTSTTPPAILFDEGPVSTATQALPAAPAHRGRPKKAAQASMLKPETPEPESKWGLPIDIEVLIAECGCPDDLAAVLFTEEQEMDDHGMGDKFRKAIEARRKEL